MRPCPPKWMAVIPRQATPDSRKFLQFRYDGLVVHRVKCVFLFVRCRTERDFGKCGFFSFFYEMGLFLNGERLNYPMEFFQENFFRDSRDDINMFFELICIWKRAKFI
jgi:hypothetical protein